MAAAESTETDSHIGLAEYGSVPQYGSAPPCHKPEADDCGRECGFYFAGVDWPVLLLPWLLFSMDVLTFSTGSNLFLGILALLFGLHLTGVLVYLSAGRGRQWMFFSLFCGCSAIAGLVLGLTLRTGEELNEPAGGRSFGYAFLVIFIGLILVLAISRALPVLGCRIVGSSAAFAEEHGWGWNPATASLMRFGCDTRSIHDMLTESHDFPEQVSFDLLRKRAYWSGEPALDYVFHMANDHTFIGVLLAHPAHPYEKYERFLVLAIVCVFIVFPVAAFETMFESHILRCIVILILVTAPRNLLRMYLKRIVIAGDEILHKDFQQRKLAERHVDQDVQQLASSQSLPEASTGSQGRSRRSLTTRWRQAALQTRVTQAFCWEVVFFAGLILLAILVIVLCCLFVQAHAKDPNEALLEGTTGLGWAFVLELIFDQFIAHRSSDKLRDLEERWFVGFFHRWRQERDEYVKRAMD